jgi:protein involved in polysaccharide export with SLBB domain
VRQDLLTLLIFGQLRRPVGEDLLWEARLVLILLTSAEHNENYAFIPATDRRWNVSRWACLPEVDFARLHRRRAHLVKTMLRFSRHFLSLTVLVAILLGQGIGVRAADVETSHLLAPNDMVEIKVFQEDDLEAKLRISQRGTITFPLVGIVSIGGKTPQDAAALIRAALAKDYLVNPQVTLTVLEYGKRRFTVLGQVQRAGSFDIPEREKITLLDAIAMAGGYTRIADPSKVTLRRKAEGKETVLRLNAKTMARDGNVDPVEIRPGDIITIGESLF